ncbi:hypothetical protein ABZ342_40330 [Amycolatopsis sp. NPDC005961]|uniref:hypothetical protein n=1 Tax=Amycolatopsis sp. NPDC005961 TaxID=3156720 RepID=UPI0033F1780A
MSTGVPGDERATDTGAVHDVAGRCGYLPLAIRPAAARLRARPSWTVRYLAERLCGRGSPSAPDQRPPISLGPAAAVSFPAIPT